MISPVMNWRHRLPTVRDRCTSVTRNHCLRKVPACVPGSFGPPDYSRTSSRSSTAPRSASRAWRPATDSPPAPGVLSTFVVLQIDRLRGRTGARGPAAGPLRLQGADRLRRGADGGGPARRSRSPSRYRRRSPHAPSSASATRSPSSRFCGWCRTGSGRPGSRW